MKTHVITIYSNKKLNSSRSDLYFFRIKMHYVVVSGQDAGSTILDEVFLRERIRQARLNHPDTNQDYTDDNRKS